MRGTRARRRAVLVDTREGGEVRIATTSALYEDCGQRALVVARSLTADRRAAEQIVVDVFAAIDGLPRCIDAKTERQRVFAGVVTRCSDPATLETGRNQAAWDSLRWRHRVVLALTSRGRCSLDDVATIMATDRTQIAEDIRAALHAIK